MISTFAREVNTTGILFEHIIFFLSKIVQARRERRLLTYIHIHSYIHTHTGTQVRRKGKEFRQARNPVEAFALKLRNFVRKFGVRTIGKTSPQYKLDLPDIITALGESRTFTVVVVGNSDDAVVLVFLLSLSFSFSFST